MAFLKMCLPIPDIERVVWKTRNLLLTLDIVAVIQLPIISLQTQNQWYSNFLDGMTRIVYSHKQEKTTIRYGEKKAK